MDKYVLVAEDAEHFCQEFNSLIREYGQVSIYDLFNETYLLGTFEHDLKHKDILYGWDKPIEINKMFKQVNKSASEYFFYELTLPEAKFLY